MADEDGEGPAAGPAELMFTIVVHGMPSFRGLLVDDQRYEVDPDVDLPVTLLLPAADESNGELTYHLKGKLPPGLKFDDDPQSPKIEGTLSADAVYGDETDGYALTYWATDEDGDESDPLTFTLRVNGKPNFDDPDVRVIDMSYEAGADMSLTLPRLRGVTSL